MKACSERLAEATLFAGCGNDLGEGVLWHSSRESLFWVDINRNQLFECQRGGNPYRWQLEVQATALARVPDRDDQLWLLTSCGLLLFSLQDGRYDPLGDFGLEEGFRSNDGAPGPRGRFWFGSMQQHPSGQHGKLYSVGPGGDYRVERVDIGIPNTFVTGPDGKTLYISDSLVQRSYRLGPDSGLIAEYLDLSDSAATPDGGALDAEGNIWIALWDGFRVGCFSPDGEELAQVPLPVPRPTNCCFGGRAGKTLFITSASEGLDAEQLKEHPFSGAVFCAELPVAGSRPVDFNTKAPQYD